MPDHESPPLLAGELRALARDQLKMQTARSAGSAFIFSTVRTASRSGRKNKDPPCLADLVRFIRQARDTAPLRLSLAPAVGTLRLPEAEQTSRVSSTDQGDREARRLLAVEIQPAPAKQGGRFRPAGLCRPDETCVPARFAILVDLAGRI